MSQDIVLLIPFYFFLFICQNSDITASSLTKSIENEEHPGIHFHDELIVKRNKREVGRTLSRETKSNYLKKLYEGFYKYKTSKKLNYSISNSWGAGGMPFNVLYAPNAYQQKILKSMLKKTFVSVEEKSRTLNEQTKQIPEVYDLVLQDDKGPAKSEMKASMKLNTPRKYYSLIPQLFVSYGCRGIHQQMTGFRQFHALPTTINSNGVIAPSATSPWLFDSIRTIIRNKFPKPSEVKRIKVHGWKTRLSTKNGRRVIMRRILKGRWYLSH